LAGHKLAYELLYSILNLDTSSKVCMPKHTRHTRRHRLWS